MPSQLLIHLGYPVRRKREPLRLEATVSVCETGNPFTQHYKGQLGINLGRVWLGKRVRVTVEELPDAGQGEQ